MIEQFAAVEALLRQQNEFIRDQFEALKDEANSRFDRVETRMDRMETRLAAVEFQTTKTNGTVTRHTEQISTLFKGDPDKEPLLTMSQGALLKRAVTLAVSIGTALYFTVRWVWANWATLVPGLVGAVG